MTDWTRRTRKGLAERRAVLQTSQELVRRGLPHAPEGLIDAAARTRFGTIEGSPRCLSFGAFECRLDDDARVDFIGGAVFADGGDLALLRAPVGAEEPATTRLLRRWARPGPLRRAASAVWLEYDVPTGGVARPFVYFRLDESWAGGAAVALRALGNLHALPAGCDEVLERCRRTLPVGGAILHVATTPGRDVDNVRLHHGLPRDEIGGYLARLGWAGDPSRLRRLLAVWPAETLGVQLDFAGGVRTTLDLEFYRPTAPARDPAWAPFLAALRGWGVCDADKLRLACLWPAPDGLPALAEQWPVQVLRDLQLKVRLAADGCVSVKAYLGFTPRILLSTALLAQAPAANPGA